MSKLPTNRPALLSVYIYTASSELCMIYDGGEGGQCFRPVLYSRMGEQWLYQLLAKREDNESYIYI